MRIIAGDVGGTKTLLQIVEAGAAGRRVVDEERFLNEQYGSFDLLLAEFLERHPGSIECACFAVAGPVLSNAVELTNLGWMISGADLERSFPIRRMLIVNDFYAVAVGIPYLGAPDVVSLNEGRRDRSSPIAILGAGTGLGEAFLIPDEIGWRVVPSEGGHSDFAPVAGEHIALLEFLREKHHRVSYERILSGPGLSNIHSFLLSRSGQEERELAPEEIARLAAEGDGLAGHALDIFVEIYGAEAGNLALKVIARGGVYLAGGIAGKHVERFRSGHFLQFYRDKGRFSSLVGECPVDLIINPAVGLLGASILAMRECGAMPLHKT